VVYKRIMVNQSKSTDPRMWEKWRASGAVGTMDDAYRNIGKQSKARVLVFGKKFSNMPWDMIRFGQALRETLGDSVSQVNLHGEGAYSMRADELAEWAVIGQGRSPLFDETAGGCDIYVGIKTPEKYLGRNVSAKDGLDVNVMGERGLKLAERAGIPRLMLDFYDHKKICDFVQEQTR